MSISSKYPSVRPTKVINLSKETLLNSDVEYSRGGAGTYIDENGLIVSAIPGQPRFNHDPETLEYKGLLVEEARTNSTRNSTDLSSTSPYYAGASGTTYTFSTNQTVAPDGTMTAGSILFTGAYCGFAINSTGVTDPTITVSLFAKYITGSANTHVRIQLSPLGGGNNYGLFNLTNGTSSKSGFVSNVIITPFPNGWYRCSVTATHSTTWPQNAGDIRIWFHGETPTETSINNTDRTYVWGVQLEAGSYPTSYIPTSGSAVTRPADSLSVPLPGSAVKSGRIGFTPEQFVNTYAPSFVLKDSSLPAKPYVLELGSANSAPFASVVYNSVRQGTTSIPALPATAPSLKSTLSFNFESTTGAVEISSTASDDADSHVLALPSELSRPVPSDQTLDLLEVNVGGRSINLKEIYLWEAALSTDQLASVSGELRSIGQPIEFSTGVNKNSDYIDAGIRPTLDLRFAERKDLFDDTTEQNLVTFSRGSIGTYVDENGIVQTAVADEPRFDHDPATGESLGLLVEEARTNRQPYSSKYDTSHWGFSYGIKRTPNATVAPDGTLTATLIQQDTSDSIHQLAGGFGSNSGYITINSTYTLSLYVKYYNSNKIRLMEQYTYGGPTTGSYTKAGVIFNFETESIEKTIQWNGESQSRIAGYSVNKLPNGWYRLNLSVIPGTDSNNQRVYFGIYPQEGNLSAPSSIPSGAVGIVGQNYTSLTLVTNFVGDGSTGVYIWGAQVEQGTFPTSHIPTPATFTSRGSTATYYDANGVIQTAGIDVARDNAYFPDENGVMKPAGLLLEAAGTNLYTRSQAPISADVIRTSITLNSAIAPDGTSTAITLTPTNINDHAWAPYFTGLTANTNYTLSLFVKAKELSRIQLGTIGTVGMVFNASTGQIISGSGTVQKLSNGWYRCSCTVPSNASGIWDTRVYIQDNAGNISYTANGIDGIYMWGFQFEIGSYPTSYIPTAGSTVTRAADVSTSATVTRSADVAQITGTNFSSWYNQDEGTWFGSIPTILGSSGRLVEVTGPGASDYSLSIRPRASSSRVDFARSGSNAPQINVTFPVKIAASYSSASVQGAANGTLASLLTTGSHSNSTSVNIGRMPSENTYLGGTISRFTYWPVRLPDTTLQVLTDPAISTWDLIFDSSLSTNGTCAVITASTCTYTIDWGDSTPVETINATGTGFEATHRYTFPQTYKAKIEVLSGAFRPYYNNSAYAGQLVEIGPSPDGWTNTSTSGFGTNLNRAWWGANNLKKIDRKVNITNVTTFREAWFYCSSLTNFPANMFNTAGTLISLAFYNAFTGCALSAKSIENILTSLDTNGQSGINLGINGGTNASKSTWTAVANAAYDSLVVKGWVISYNA